MVTISSIFDLFEEYDEYRSYLPTVFFVYLYHLSGVSNFLFAAIFFGVIATMIVVIGEWESRIIRMKNRYSSDYLEKIYDRNWIDSVKLLFLVVNSVGYASSAIIGWNNIVKSDLKFTLLDNYYLPPSIIQMYSTKYIDEEGIILIGLFALIVVVIFKTIFGFVFMIAYYTSS